ncbi:MAG TPA: O-antigen ligase family protein, partial [Candidatus Acidoferrum sp.]|nr:O-antigen ligase family protein [Candidatus Acidoferrum sp.]
MWNPKNCSLWLPTLLLAGVLISLPWAGGGRSPIGQVSLILVLALAGIAGVFTHRLSALASPSPLLFVGGVLAAGSALHTIYPDRTVQSLILLVAYLLAGVLAAEAARESPRLEDILLAAILTSGTLVTIVGMIRLLYHSDEGLYARLLTGPFQYPNAMAGFLLLVGGAALAVARGERGPVGRIAATAITVLVLFGLALTRSRGAWLAAGAGLFIVVAMEWRGQWPGKRLAFCLCGCVLLAMIAWLSWRLAGPLPILQTLAERQEFSSLVWRWHILQWTW